MPFFFFHRGLFEKHKLMFSFMVCIDILRHSGDISDEEWNFFLRGTTGVDKVIIVAWGAQQTRQYQFNL